MADPYVVAEESDLFVSKLAVRGALFIFPMSRGNAGRKQKSIDLISISRIEQSTTTRKKRLNIRLEAKFSKSRRMKRNMPTGLLSHL
ncbi:predicted protein [Coccidioides posadasii str. Silveira]|uniref:Predicted protein n=1 Tax=Coccidioides posadasii (strain RMSCC 757 / Silveira) TaxID=443226 RepID=E9D6S9_COCPS|nr:predicted protein [Coccidioides posadasii str. Silveira]